MADYDEIYDHLKLYPDEPVVLTVIKGVLGAIVGAVPGFGLWLLLARLNFVSAYCGAIIALGAVMGFSFMTKKNELPAAVGIVICGIVLIGAVYLAERIDWAWEIMNMFEEQIYPDFTAAMQEYDAFSGTEIDASYREALREEFGFAEANFSNCFANLSTLIEFFDVKGQFYISLAQSGLFALIGGGVGLTKFRK